LRIGISDTIGALTAAAAIVSSNGTRTITLCCCYLRAVLLPLGARPVVPFYQQQVMDQCGESHDVICVSALSFSEIVDSSKCWRQVGSRQVQTRHLVLRAWSRG
jgi:hypothetical protein